MGTIAFSAVVLYLHDAMVDRKVLSYRDVHSLDDLSASVSSSGKAMVLYGNTLRNLDILPSHDASGNVSSFSLFHAINRTCSPFGKRLLRQWLCSPLVDPEDILNRQGAVRAMNEQAETREKARKALKLMCDFERFMAWIFAASYDVEKEEGSGEEAIFYDKDTKMKANITRLISCLEGFSNGIQLVKTLVESAHCEGLGKVLDCPEVAVMEERIEDFRKTFSFSEAAKTGTIKPVEGVSDEYDAALGKVRKLL